MLVTLLILAAIVNIGGKFNNYNIKNHPLDIRVRRDAANVNKDVVPLLFTILGSKTSYLDAPLPRDISGEHTNENLKQKKTNIILVYAKDDPSFNFFAEDKNNEAEETAINKEDTILHNNIPDEIKHLSTDNRHIQSTEYDNKELAKSVSRDIFTDKTWADVYRKLTSDISFKSPEQNDRNKVPGPVIVAAEVIIPDKLLEEILAEKLTVTDSVKNEIEKEDYTIERRKKSVYNVINNYDKEIPDINEEKMHEIGLSKGNLKPKNGLFDLLFNLVNKESIGPKTLDRVKRNASYSEVFNVTKHLYSNNNATVRTFFNNTRNVNPRYPNIYRGINSRYNGTMQTYGNNGKYRTQRNNIFYNNNLTANNQITDNRYNERRSYIYNSQPNSRYSINNNQLNNQYPNNPGHYQSNYNENAYQNNINITRYPIQSWYNPDMNKPNSESNKQFNYNQPRNNNYYQPYNGHYNGNLNENGNNRNNIYSNNYSANNIGNNQLYSPQYVPGTQQGKYRNDMYSNYYSINNPNNNNGRNIYNSQYILPVNSTTSSTNVPETTSTTATPPIILESCFMCSTSGCPKFFKKIGFLCVKD